MTTIAALRTTYLNGYVGRSDGATQPWSDAECDRALGDSINRLWPDFGRLQYGEVASDEATQFFAVPASVVALAPYKISRIIIRQGAPGSGGLMIDQASGWRQDVDDQFFIRTRILGGQTFGVYAFVAFTVTTLDATLEASVSARAASFLYGNLVGKLVDFQRQQNLDTGRVVSYADAVGASAYWERQYQESTIRHPSRIAFAPRASNRSR